jgi:hypothetical protein
MNNTNKNYIFVNAFYNGFIDKTDCNHIGFFESIFKNTKLNNFEITNDLNKANILLESCFGNSICLKKKWDKKIFFSGESWRVNLDNYDIIIKSSYTNGRTIDLPLCVYYIHNNNFLDRITEKRIISTIPPKFCCFCVSNGGSRPRNHMFEILNSYKKVDSLGKYNNNVGYNINYPYWSEEYRDYLKQYKFIICFENSKYDTYVTEKIINAHLSKIIPIYWGTNHVKNMFYENSFIYLENENSQQSYADVLKRVIELDQDDSKYLEFINRPILNEKFFQENYSIDIITKKINNLL